MDKSRPFGFTTTILHSDRQKNIEHGSLHKPIHTAVAYGYKDARELAEVFQGKKAGYRYGRQGNPTVSALEDKITRMEDGLVTLCFSTGMAAIGALVQGLLRAGDHVVSSSFLFGNKRCNRTRAWYLSRPSPTLVLRSQISIVSVLYAVSEVFCTWSTTP